MGNLFWYALLAAAALVLVLLIVLPPYGDEIPLFAMLQGLFA